MTYYLQTIQEFITASGYSNVFYDFDNPSSEERIFIQNTGGPSMDPNQPALERDFSVYIRRSSRANARTDAEAIFALLAGNEQALEGILKISVTQPPMLFTIDVDSGNQSEFVINCRCLIVDNTLNRLY